MKILKNINFYLYDFQKDNEKSNKICFEYVNSNLVKQNSYDLFESDRSNRTIDGYFLDKEV